LDHSKEVLKHKELQFKQSSLVAYLGYTSTSNKFIKC